jgi:hypothetical protein
MRRLATRQVVLVGAIAVVAVVALGIAGVAGVFPDGCACASLGSEAPWPVSEQRAIAAARPYLSAGDIGLERSGTSGHRLYVLTAPGGLVLIDGETGSDLEAAFWAAMPDTAQRTIPADAATRNATDFLRLHSIDVAGLTPAVDASSEVGMDLVAWSDAGGARVMVAVNAATGDVASFTDLRSGVRLVAPTLTRAAAEPRALAVLDVAGEQVLSGDVRVEFDATGTQRSVWSFGLGVPSSTQADVYLDGAVVEVDAHSGEATVVKR